MRILFITASLPYPPASGGAIRTLGIMDGLHNAGHELTLLSFSDGKVNPAETPLATYCKVIEVVEPPTRTKSQRLKQLLLTNQPDISQRFYSPIFEARLREILTQHKFDLVQFEAIESVCYLPLVKQLQPKVKICFDTFNAEYELQRRIFEIDRQQFKRLPMAFYSYLQIGRIKRFEGKMCQASDIVVAVSEEDAELLRPLCEDKQVSVVPSGVFVDDYAKVDEPIDLPPNSLVFTGTMDYRPNVDAMIWFTEHVFPKIQAQVADVSLYIVGNKPHTRLLHLNDHPNIHLTGWVDSTLPHLHASTIYIAPLRMGSGTRLKLLEAMSAQCAIVATTIASDGMLADAKNGMIIVDDPQQMANTIVELLDDDEKRNHLGKTTLDLVKQYYDWSVLIPRLLEAYKGIGLG